MHERQQSIAVIGAGMVGTCCALYLQREGYQVTLIDPKHPGEEASFGNLACIGIASCVPPGMPGIIKKVPGMLMDPLAPLKLRWRDAIPTLPWFLRYIANSRPERVEAIASARQSLLNKAHEALDPLVDEAGAQTLMNKGGLMFTFESEAAFQDASYAFDVRRRNGVQMEILDGNEARELEPALSDKIARVVRIPNLTHTYNPGNLVKSLAQLFKKKGGICLQRRVNGFTFADNGVQALVTDQGNLPVEAVVIAAGVWSGKLARMLGTRVPLTAERGYHVMFHGTGVKVNSALLSVDHYVSVTPMDYGVRVGGTAEFAAPDAPLNQKTAHMVRQLGERLVPALAADPGSHVTQWVGSRPSHPDSKPVIGRAPKQKNAFFAFGHDHLGLTMGAITGKLLSQVVAQKAPSVDLTPFRPDRF